MKKFRFLLKNIAFVLFFLLSSHVNGQRLQTDSTKVQSVPESATELHSPKKASLYSAILPGLGQAYNKKYWKIPIIYAGFGTLGYFIGWNNKFYKTYKNAYVDLTDGDENTNSHLDLDATQYYDLTNPTEYNNFKTGLTKQQEYFRRNRDLLIILTAGFYGLNIIDASVDAHFFDFDISDDLSFNWQPTTNLFESQLIYGFNCTFNF
ncbi:MAG: hypothetical protein JXR61_01325 [Prolixibacteraceae bacterium]|nr:hypothetical protein [Prolixibacteraceae bacterium]